MKTLSLRYTSRKLLAQLLDEPNLATQLAGLSGPEWKAVVSSVGLEDSGELLALASHQQLLEVFDEELWIQNAASAETIDAERFATVLEVFHDFGIEELARKLATLSEELLRLALGSMVTVWSSEFLMRQAEDDESGQLEKKLESCQAEELGEYLILSPSGVGWDVLVELLATWNESEPVLLDRLLSRLAAATEEEVQGSDDLFAILDGMNELREEAEAEREERRAALGYVSTSDARAFLRLPRLQEPGPLDAISKAYFRRLEPRSPPTKGKAPRSRALSQLIKCQSSNRTALSEPDSLIKRAMRHLEKELPETHVRCVEELAFLVNVVAVASDLQDVAGNPADALRAVSKRIETTGLAAVTSSADEAARLLAELLAQWGPIGLFRRGDADLVLEP